MRSIMITGANGYIGSFLVKKCLELGYNTVAVDIDNTYVDKRAEYINADILKNLDCFLETVKVPDVLIHLAWKNSFYHNDISHLSDLEKHYYFIKKMIDKGVRYVTVMGSMHEIGYYEGAVNEKTPCNPMSLYGIAKNALRQSLECYVIEKDVYLHWLRAFYIIGNDNRNNSVFGKIIKSEKKGEKVFPLNSGKNKYDFISIYDLCEQIMCASVQNKINGIINVCSGKPVSLSEMVEQFVKENNLRIQLKYGMFPDRVYDSPIVYGDNSKIKEILENERQINENK